MKKRTRQQRNWWRVVAVSAGLLLMLRVLLGGVQFRHSDEEIVASFGQGNFIPQVGRYAVGGHTIRYVSVGADSLPVVVLVHGAPSSLSGYSAYLRDSLLLRHVRLVAVDRPGYGYSDFGASVTSIREQARLLAPLLRQFRQRPLVLVGSSYGGAVIARLAMDHPEAVDGLVLISAALAPGLEKTYWISYPANWLPFRWLVPTLLRVANDEKLSHRQSLEEMLPDWPRIRAGVTLLHGERDGLVYYENAAFAEQQLTNAADVCLVSVPDEGHGLPWSRFELVRTAILERVAASEP